MRFKNSSLETRCRRPLYSRGPEEVTTTASSVVVVLSTPGGGWLCLGRSSSIGSSSHVSEATLYVVTLTGWSERSALNPYRPSDGKTSRTREVASRACRLSSQGTRATPDQPPTASTVRASSSTENRPWPGRCRVTWARRRPAKRPKKQHLARRGVPRANA